MYPGIVLMHLDRRKSKLTFFVSIAILSRFEPAFNRAAVLFTEFSKKMFRFLSKKEKVEFFKKKLSFFVKAEFSKKKS